MFVFATLTAEATETGPERLEQANVRARCTIRKSARPQVKRSKAPPSPDGCFSVFNAGGLRNAHYHLLNFDVVA